MNYLDGSTVASIHRSAIERKESATGIEYRVAAKATMYGLCSATAGEKPIDGKPAAGRVAAQ